MFNLTNSVKYETQKIHKKEIYFDHKMSTNVYRNFAS